MIEVVIQSLSGLPLMGSLLRCIGFAVMTCSLAVQGSRFGVATDDRLRDGGGSGSEAVAARQWHNGGSGDVATAAAVTLARRCATLAAVSATLRPRRHGGKAVTRGGSTVTARHNGGRATTAARLRGGRQRGTAATRQRR
jgi:hypothetical protein